MKRDNGHLRRTATMMCLACAIGIAGCLGIDSKVCGDLYCPAWFKCTDYETCGPPEQVDACEKELENADCTYGEGVKGTCTEGVCVPPEGDDGTGAPSEACDGGNQIIHTTTGDDGNTDPGDGCDAGCQIEPDPSETEPRSSTDTHIWERP